MAKGPFKNKILLGLLSAVTVMFFFSFLLVPLYNVFCEVTGLNGKIYGPSDFFKKQDEIKEREINIKFLSTVSGAAPIEFYPSVQNLLVITDTVSATTYIAENKTNIGCEISVTITFQEKKKWKSRNLKVKSISILNLTFEIQFARNIQFVI